MGSPHHSCMLSRTNTMRSRMGNGMATRTMAGKRILVTGASQGIGYAFALEAAKQGARVVASARSAEPLQDSHMEAAGVVPVVGDVTVPADRDAMLRAAREHFGGLDILVNNAGLGATGLFGDTKPDTLRRVMEVNFFALADLTRLCLPELQKGVQPLVVNVSSILGRRGIPRYSEYCASKFAVQGFSDALRAELSKVNVGVLVVNPGPTETGFQENMVERDAGTPRAAGRMPAATVATAMCRAIERDRAEITLTRVGVALVLANRYFPRLLDWYLRREFVKG